jgi:hypothetical protein
MSEQKPQIITRADIPGMTPELEAAIDARRPAPTPTGPRPMSEFKGNPQRMIGHPSNPATHAAEMTAAMLDQAKAQRMAREAEVAAAAVAAAADPNIISEIPFSVPEASAPQAASQPVIDHVPFDRQQ